MDFSTYQKKARKTATYPDVGNNFIYPTLGVAGESGEVVEKIKKLIRNDGITSANAIRDDKRLELQKEIGDVLWYLAQLCTELGITLEDAAVHNLEKLSSRKDRGVLHSEGDNR